MTPGERWLQAIWPLVLGHLPPHPARVIDLGCGALGGFVPMLRAAGYDAIGIDPEAPDDANYIRSRFEDADVDGPIDAIVASTSLHHVADPSQVIHQMASALKARGTVVVIEWDWDKFDEKTARWCFERLGSDGEKGWLHHRRDEWVASGQDWPTYLRDWAGREQLNRGDQLIQLLDKCFERSLLAHGPYFFSDLVATSAADEQAAIDAGLACAARIDYAGTSR